jgi:putative transposase
MPRKARSCPGGYVYHVWNRAAGRLRIFKKDQDFLAFERVMLQAHERHPLAILDWCLMPNHWHMVVHPDEDRQVTDFFRWLTQTHSMRWHVAHAAVGTGPLYQGRFKTLPVQQDPHLLTLLRYVARNPLRAGLVKKAEDWPWTGGHVRRHGPAELKSILSPWPVDRPRTWTRWLNQPQTDREMAEILECIKRQRPIGDAEWVSRTAKKLDLQQTLRGRGRPTFLEKEVRPL